MDILIIGYVFDERYSHGENDSNRGRLRLPQPVFVDLRSPVEYEEAIFRCCQLPLLEDEERSLIGKLYKEQSPETSIEEGFAILPPSSPCCIKRIKELSPERGMLLSTAGGAA